MVNESHGYNVSNGSEYIWLCIGPAVMKSSLCLASLSEVNKAFDLKVSPRKSSKVTLLCMP